MGLKKLKFILLFYLILSVPDLVKATDITIGTGTGTTYYNPIYGYTGSSYCYSYTQQIYTSAEIIAAGGTSGMLITALSFYFSSGSLSGNDNWDVYLGNTATATYSSGSAWISSSALTRVYSGTVSGTIGNWMTITLTSPFIWDGTSNLVVAVDENNSSYTGSTSNFQYTSTTSSYYRTIYRYGNSSTNIDPAAPGTGTRYYYRPNIKITFTDCSASCTCSCSGSCIDSDQPGNWDDCNTWGISDLDVSCTGWSTATIMGNRKQIIKSGHTVTVPSGISSYHSRSAGIYVEKCATLTFGDEIEGQDYSANEIYVCGTLNYNAASTSDFSGATLTVGSGGIVNITSGILWVNDIVIENGGTINLSGGELRYEDNINGVWIKNGGTININNSSSKLNYNWASTIYSKIDGTFDCKNYLTSANCTNFELGNVCVTSNTSTGRIRTQTAYTPSTSSDISASNNFFGFNDTYGGTVEYYGTSAITLDATWSRYNFYDLEINNSAGVTLAYTGCHTVSGNLYLKGGKLVLNKKQINLHGTIVYTGSNYIDPGTGGGRIFFQGKTTSVVSPCMNFFTSITTDIPTSGGTSIYSQGSTVNIKNPVLKLTSTGGGTGKLEQFKVFRSDIIILNDNVTVEDDAGTMSTDPLLSVKVGIIKTGAYTLFFNNVSTSWVEHWTTGHSVTSDVGWVSGNLKRRCAAGWSYDFPVGRTDVSDFNTDYMKYRRINLENTTLSATTNFTVNFNTTFDRPDVCVGTLVNAFDYGVNYIQLHPEGWWSIVPETPPASVNYNIYAYIHGFTADPVLVDNRFGPLKRQDGSTLCADWTNGGGTLNTVGVSGRIHELDGSLEIGYAQRNGLTSFSEIAIGVTDKDIVLPIQLLSFDAYVKSNNQVEIDWVTSSEINNDYFTIERSIDGIEFFPITYIDGAGTSNTNLKYSYTDKTPFEGTSYYRLKQTDFDGKFEVFEPVAVKINNGQTFTYTIYPNPATKTLYVVYENAGGNTMFEICDLLGNKIISQTLEKSDQIKKITIDISDFEKGIYFIKMISDGDPSVEKVIIQ